MKNMLFSRGLSNWRNVDVQRTGDKLKSHVAEVGAPWDEAVITKPWVSLIVDGGTVLVSDKDFTKRFPVLDYIDGWEGDYKEELTGESCPAAVFISQRKDRGQYMYQGFNTGWENYSKNVAELDRTSGRKNLLYVRFDQAPLKVEKFGTSQPPERTFTEISASWRKGEEKQRMKCTNDENWYWVTWKARLEQVTKEPEVPKTSDPMQELIDLWKDKGYSQEDAVKIAAWSYEHNASPTPEVIQEILTVTPVVPPVVVPPAKTLRQQWDDFFKNPDVITAIGLTPSSIQESFSLVFTKYSIINDKTQEPAPGDYVSVGLILAGVALASATVVIKLLPLLAGTVSLDYIEPGLTAARVTSVGLSGFVNTIKGAALRNPILALLLLSQADIVFWGPSVLRAPIQTSVGQATGYKITLENAIRNKNWIIARSALANLEKEYDNVESQLVNFPTPFFQAVGVPFSDFQTTLETGRSAVAAYKEQFPSLEVLPKTYEKEFVADDVAVKDGDSIEVKGYPEIRILGIDAHEAETASGREEADYLKSLIEGKQVTIKTHEYGDPDKTVDIYGRLLGGVFLGDQDIALAMIEHFGKSILTLTKYQQKYRWIDWDEYKKTAEGATGPAVKEFKLYIESDPSNAKIYIDGKYTRHLTPSDEVELKDVMEMLEPGEHVIKATKAGKTASVRVNITDGVNPDIMLTLKTAGLVPEEPETPGEPPEIPEVPEPAKFVLKILSTPSRARVYVDGVYTHHLTPSDEKELSDVMNLLTPGSHVIRAEKAGRTAEKTVEIVEGFNEPIYLTLQVVGIPRSREEILAQIQGYKSIIEQLELELGTS